MFTVEGQRGVVTVGAKIATVFGPWKLTYSLLALDHRESLVSVVVLREDAFWATQGPQDLWLDLSGSWWGWKACERLSDGMYRVVGDPDVRHGLWAETDLKRPISSDSR